MHQFPLSKTAPTELYSLEILNTILHWLHEGVLSFSVTHNSSESASSVYFLNIFNRLFNFSISSGTNNARLAAMLRQLAQYHAKDPNNLFMVRLAQVGGKHKRHSVPDTRELLVMCLREWLLTLLSVPPQGLTHLGKGTLTLCPYHSDRQLMSQVAVAGLLTVLVSFLDVKNSQFIFLLLSCLLPHTLLIFLFHNLKVVFHQC